MKWIAIIISKLRKTFRVRGTYFKVNRVIHMKFQNFVTDFFQTAINSCYYHTQISSLELLDFL